MVKRVQWIVAAKYSMQLLSGRFYAVPGHPIKLHWRWDPDNQIGQFCLRKASSKVGRQQFMRKAEIAWNSWWRDVVMAFLWFCVVVAKFELKSCTVARNLFKRRSDALYFGVRGFHKVCWSQQQRTVVAGFHYCSKFLLACHPSRSVFNRPRIDFSPSCYAKGIKCCE